MILYASFRTDIPAFYGEWLYNRIKEGWLLQPNPMNANQLQKIESSDIEVIVFCSKDYRPFMKYVKWFNDNYRCIFHYTITPYDSDIEPNVLDKESIIENFKELSNATSKEQIIWRYDPILFTNKYTPKYHKEKLLIMSNELCDYTDTCIFSFVSTIYPWVKKNIPDLIDDYNNKEELLEYINSQSNLHYQTCGHGDAYSSLYPNIGISSCTSVDLLEKVFNIKCIKQKGGYYRKGCGCIQGTNIGQYNSCLHGCKYCYAARNTYKQTLYDPTSPILLGELTEDSKIYPCKAQKVFKEKEQKQLSLFDFI